MSDRKARVEQSWFQALPMGWGTRRIKDLVRLINGYPFPSELFEAEGGVPLVRIRDIGRNTTETSYLGTPVTSALITSQDVLIGMDGDFTVGRWLGSRPALLNQRVCALRSRDTALLKYIEYALPYPLGIVNQLAYSTTVKHLSSGEVLHTRVPLPDDPRTLKNIVAFLDHETARIDELVREQERLQVLLAEKRNEVIGRAVREGLDGEEAISIDDVFIRSAPPSWQVSPLRRFLKHISPRPVGEAWRDYTLLSLTRQGIIERDIDSGIGKFPAEFNGYQRVLPGQVVFCLFDMDETPRTVGFSDKRGMITSAYAAFEPTEYGDGEFISYYFQYVDTFKGLRPYYSGLRKTIRPSNFLGIRVAFPGLCEQKRIVRFLNAELEKLDSLADTVQNGIDLLLERRAALISAAVSGQLDLRDWQPPEPAAVAEVA